MSGPGLRGRGGGCAIDIRGAAREVVDRTGLLPQLREAHVNTRKLSFVDGFTLADDLGLAHDGVIRNPQAQRGLVAAALPGAVRSAATRA